MNELLEKLTLEWKILKSIARSPLGKMVFLVPFLPFAIDFLDNVVGTIEFVEKAVDTDTLSAWVENNRRTLMTMYLGLGFFLLSRIVFEIACPKSIKMHDDSDQYIVDILNKMKLSEEVNDYERYHYFRRRLDKFERIDVRYEENAKRLRFMLSIGFIISILLLVFPPLGKFIRIFFDYLWPF